MPAEAIITNCLNCDKQLPRTPPSRRQMFCNNQCRWAHANVSLVCKFCRKIFQTKRAEMERGRQFCGNKCGKKQVYPMLTCVRCGEPYQVKPSHVNFSRYCSRECQNLRATRPSKCKNCGGDFLVNSKPPYLFCGVPCYLAFQAKMRRPTTRRCAHCQESITIASSRRKQQPKFCN